jgi:hypothetical protein
MVKICHSIVGCIYSNIFYTLMYINAVRIPFICTFIFFECGNVMLFYKERKIDFKQNIDKRYKFRCFSLFAKDDVVAFFKIRAY